MLKRSLSRRGQDVQEDTSIQPLERSASAANASRLNETVDPPSGNCATIARSTPDLSAHLYRSPLTAADLNTVGISPRPSHATRPPPFPFHRFGFRRAPGRQPSNRDKIAAVTGTNEPAALCRRRIEPLIFYGDTALCPQQQNGCASMLPSRSQLDEVCAFDLLASRFPRDKILRCSVKEYNRIRTGVVLQRDICCSFVFFFFFFFSYPTINMFSK